MRTDSDTLIKMWEMDNETKNKRFSANFFSLQLQFKTLLEEAGGDDLVPFLDTLANLNRSEQKVALGIFSRVLKKVMDGPIRLETEGDLALKDFEDNLYQDLLSAIEEETKVIAKPKKKIEVLAGGKSPKADSPEDNSPIDLAAARKKRRDRRPSFVV